MIDRSYILQVYFHFFITLFFACDIVIIIIIIVTITIIIVYMHILPICLLDQNNMRYDLLNYIVLIPRPRQQPMTDHNTTWMTRNNFPFFKLFYYYHFTKKFTICIIIKLLQ